MQISRTFNKLHDDIRNYLDDLASNLPTYKREEIAAYCVYLFIIREADVVQQRYEEWRLLLKQGEHDD